MRLAASPIFHTSFSHLSNGPRGSIETVRHMRALVKESSVDPALMNAAIGIIHMVPAQDQLAEVDALFEYVRGSIRYVRDVAHVETLSDPRMTLQRMVGDCDDKSTLLAALFEAVGYPTRFVLAGYASPDQFEHVYLQVLVNNFWLDADATVFEPLGYAPPHPQKIWIEGVS